MEAALLDDYHMTIEVLGPLHSPENLKKTSIKDMDMVLKRSVSLVTFYIISLCQRLADSPSVSSPRPMK